MPSTTTTATSQSPQAAAGMGSASPRASSQQQQQSQVSQQQQAQAQAQQQHTRVYQACIPCRRRKVKCDLGPVDNPRDPPCVRCRRESKECYFSATRRKRKANGEAEDDADLSDYELRNARKSHRSTTAGPGASPGRRQSTAAPTARTSTTTSPYDGSLPPRPLTPGGSVGRYQPLRRPTEGQSGRTAEEDHAVNNQTAAILQTKEVYSGHDALNLLFEAAGRNGDIESHHRSGSSGSLQRPLPGTIATPGSQQSFASPQTNTVSRSLAVQSTGRPASQDPATTQPFTASEPASVEDSYQQALKAWSRFRFVRAGWMTAKEAVAYIDYFYRYLSPLTPIIIPNYQDYAKHGMLLQQEPMLVVTLLTIASRYMELSGPGGGSRPFVIHEKLWNYLQGMIDRVIWGQEQFGGGFCGAGAVPSSDVNPLSRKGLRTLGTIESLMLLTEWHPRALHFPPGDDDDELLIPEAPAVRTDDPNEGVGGQRIDSWLEPCWRSDRMCWMLLGNAMALAFEIGVFDETSEMEFEQANRGLPRETVKAYFRRKNHLKDLLVIYLTQTSGRFGLTSMLPKADKGAVPLMKPNRQFQERVARQMQSPNILIKDDGVPMSKEARAQKLREDTHDLVLDYWDKIARIMEVGNEQMFPNRRLTREHIKSGKYVELLQYFQHPLREWWEGFEQATAIPINMRHILTIEYEYSRVYLNSLALQAVVERCTHSTPAQTAASAAGGGDAAKSDGTTTIPQSTLMQWYGNDRYYIQQVIDASRNVLHVVVDGLWPGNYLKHAPVRTFFRIVSVAIILLKTFALGATEDDVAISLGLMDRAVEALRTSIVDDVHVGNRFADLLDTLTNRIRARFVRMAAGTGVSRGASNSPVQQQQPQSQRQSSQASSANAMMPPPPSSMNGWSGYNSGSANGNVDTTTTRSNPSLYGISTEPYDPTRTNVSIMPPPSAAFAPSGNSSTFTPPHTSYTHSQQQQQQQQPQQPQHPHHHPPGLPTAADGTAGAVPEGFHSDWLALPLDPLLNNYGADVNQTTFGPDVGGYDLLDVLLNQAGEESIWSRGFTSG